MLTNNQWRFGAIYLILKTIMTSFVKLNDTDANGEPYTMDTWADQTLTGDEYYDYLKAKARQDAIIGRAIADEILIVEEVFEEVFSASLQVNVKIRVGTKITVKEGHTVAGDPEFLEFESRYAKDPKVNYRPVNN